ncbi:MAG: helix-turn-helix transcriptional regulator [Spirochaetales bacterium]|nr:helix-turn-helix transcriptional regulator [Spirochaetales bacterium]MBQ7281734.1 helix-turn-helix transcriptional regulator [Spirochaetales bacterium]
MIRLARERNLSGPQVYRRAGIDAKHYSKIISDRNYQPKKDTVLALAIAYNLSVYEAETFLSRAGYSFNPSAKVDGVVLSLMKAGIYDRKIIDNVMMELELPLLPRKWA